MTFRMSVMEIDDVFIDDIADSLIDSHVWKDNGITKECSDTSTESTATATFKVSKFHNIDVCKSVIYC